MDQLQEQLVQFLADNGIDKAWYAEQVRAGSHIPRFVRVNPFPPCTWESSNPDQASNHALTEFLRKPTLDDAAPPVPVAWHQKSFGVTNRSPALYALPYQTKLSAEPAYLQGLIYGVDAASCLTVFELDPQPGDKVLDLCCAPGAKLCMLADLMKRSGSLVGVDASSSRLTSCTSLLKKYRSASPLPEAHVDHADWSMHVLLGDGTKVTEDAPQFEVVWDTESDRLFFFDGKPNEGVVAAQQPVVETSKSGDAGAGVGNDASNGSAALTDTRTHGSRKRTRMNKSMRARIKRQRQEQKAALPSLLARHSFDKVLVDAECTHDGSIRHISKYADNGTFGLDALEDKFLKANRTMDSVTELQKHLLQNGFDMLKVGGTLVYSTCSFSQAQNEDVVQWLVSNNSDAKVVDVVFEFTDRTVDVTCTAQVSERIANHLPCGRKGRGSTGAYCSPTITCTSGLFICKLTRVE